MWHTTGILYFIALCLEKDMVCFMYFPTFMGPIDVDIDIPID